MVVVMMFLTFRKTIWQEHIPFPCIIAVSVKANPESLMTVRTAHSLLHSPDSSLGVTTNFFLTAAFPRLQPRSHHQLLSPKLLPP